MMEKTKKRNFEWSQRFKRPSIGFKREDVWGQLIEVEMIRDTKERKRKVLQR